MNPEHKLFFSCTANKYVADEYVVPAHAITYIYDGEFIMTNSTDEIRLGKNALVYYTKNTLFRFTKSGTKECPYKSITVRFDDQFLQNFFQKNEPQLSYQKTNRNFQVRNHKLWDNFFSSLQPYVEDRIKIPDGLIIAKQLEALSILRSLYPGVDHHLSNFGMPGKIDLEAFMHKNYIFNLPLERFAYLTGRSLSTFQRDFSKIFDITPQRWLTQKRLELARQLIEDKKVKPSQAFIEAGFENLSHFSRAFKNEFGFSPRQIYDCSSKLI